MTGFLTRPLAGLFQESRRTQNASLVGRVVKITTERADHAFGQGEIDDGGGGITVEPLIDYEKAGANDWYDIPRRTGKPALIEVRIDPQAITTATTIDAIRKAAQERIAASSRT